MSIAENIGQFYLGTETYPDQGIPVCYDNADLTTHAVIVGMTGSGKTGLGISLLEEAALDNIPVIAIDPKGDLGNLALNFPELDPQSFAPWADETALNRQGILRSIWAEQTAARWREGLKNSDQSVSRMQMLHRANPVHIYTPGSDHGIPISVLANLSPPDETVRCHDQAYGEYLDATAAALLTLLKEKTDTFSPAHIVLCKILRYHWDLGQTLSPADIIADLQNPPFDKIGILPTEQVLPGKARAALAIQLNALLAAPAFAGWLKGIPLAVRNLLYDDENRAQTAVLNIAHLTDEERMFFVTLLLSRLIAYMRTLPGTNALRAVIYMDEIAGYLPPNANPPSKALFLTLLKQARAFGIGLVLSSQNPIDLDYKALSNAGTWFIGRLQTAQDRTRLFEGLTAAQGQGRNSAEIQTWFDRLEKRQFLLHNIHKNTPCIFRTRHTMSYLAGPLTRKQIQTLTGNRPAASAITNLSTRQDRPPALPPGIACYYLPGNGNGATLHYYPLVLAEAQLYFSDSKSQTRHMQRLLLECPFQEDDPNWQAAQISTYAPEQLQNDPYTPAIHHPPPASAQQSSAWLAWEKSLKVHLRQHQTLTLYYSPLLKSYSDPGESEAAFRNRITPDLHLQRDSEMLLLRQKYSKKQILLDKQLLAADTALERENAQAGQSWIDAGLAIGGALLSAFTGRKMLSQSNIRRATGAISKINRAKKERHDISAATEKYALIEQQIDNLTTELQQALAQLRNTYAPENTPLESRSISPKSSDIEITFIALGYQPLR